MVEGVTGHPEESYRKKSYILIATLYKGLISKNKITNINQNKHKFSILRNTQKFVRHSKLKILCSSLFQMPVLCTTFWKIISYIFLHYFSSATVQYMRSEGLTLAMMNCFRLTHDKNLQDRNLQGKICCSQGVYSFQVLSIMLQNKIVDIILL